MRNYINDDCFQNFQNVFPILQHSPYECIIFDIILYYVLRNISHLLIYYPKSVLESVLI